MWRVVLVLLVACNEKHAPQPSEPHWTKRPIVTASGTTKNGVAFTIDLPEGMRARPRGKTAIEYDLNERRTGIRFVISEGCVEDALEDMTATHRDDTKWIRRDTLPAGGFIASYENPDHDDANDLIVKACHPFGDEMQYAGSGMTCYAEVTPWHDGDRVRDALPVAEKLCLSLRRPGT